jgi:exodeoxyribonuclease-3
VKVATWNVNSVKARLPNVLDWLTTEQPDVVCLQEIKCQTADFPASEIRQLGYEMLVHGQKSYNGVAILSRLPMADTVLGLPALGLPDEPADEQARYVEATIGDLRICCLYLPNGNPVGTEKYDYKLRWMDRLIAHTRGMLDREIPFVLTGDFNICPTDDDVYDPVGWQDDALCRPQSRAKYRELLWLGLTDAFRQFDPSKHVYSFWDYQQGRWPRDEGLRIDHFLLSPRAADRVSGCHIDRAPRGREKASDHTPVICDFTP